MSILKIQLLAAAGVAAIVSGTPAQAQFAFPVAEINGAGASLPANALRQGLDCYGSKAALQFSGAASATNPASIADFDFQPAPTATKTLGNTFNCAAGPNDAGDLTSRTIQPNVTAYYISTGSGAGRTAWVNHAKPAVVFPDAAVEAKFTANAVQWANSDDPLAQSLLDTYNNTLVNGSTSADKYGPAIQIPLAIAPVAFAYDPVYKKVVNASNVVVEYKFKVGGARADGSGGLKLTRAQYCGIFNGTITNFNQLPTTVVNKDPADPAAFNVPIRLVGRQESSGTTALFTRALAAQCDASVGAATNKFDNGESLLPRPASTISPTNSLSGAVFNKGSTPSISGTEVAGLFMVANGSDGVAQAIDYLPNPVGIGSSALNGKLGYIGPDYTLPAVLFTQQNNYGLNTASLQVNGTGTTYVGPTAKDATASFGTGATALQPPQSKGTAGAYCTDAAACPSAYGNRNNPLSWVQLGTKDQSLAAPLKGYPIVGTTNLLLYTCYATPAVRQAVNGTFATFMGKTTKDNLNQAFPATLIVDGVKGVLAKNGLGPMPAGWRTAITETFFKNSTQLGKAGDQTSKLGLRNLWIQDKIPTTPTGPGSVTAGNSICVGKVGA